MSKSLAIRYALYLEWSRANLMLMLLNWAMVLVLRDLLCTIHGRGAASPYLGIIFAVLLPAASSGQSCSHELGARMSYIL